MAVQIDIGKFEIVVNAISDLKAKGEVKISFAINSMTIEINRELTDDMLNTIQMQKETFDNIVKEILMISHNIINDNKENLITRLKEKDENIEKKVQLLEAKFIDNEFKIKYLLSRTYKTNILDKFDWEVFKKSPVEGGIQFNEFPVALLRFRIRHTFSDSPPIEKTQTFVFESISIEIDDMINQLNKIKNQLDRLR